MARTTPSFRDPESVRGNAVDGGDLKVSTRLKHCCWVSHGRISRIVFRRNQVYIADPRQDP